MYLSCTFFVLRRPFFQTIPPPSIIHLGTTFSQRGGVDYAAKNLVYMLRALYAVHVYLADSCSSFVAQVHI